MNTLNIQVELTVAALRAQAVVLNNIATALDVDGTVTPSGGVSISVSPQELHEQVAHEHAAGGLVDGLTEQVDTTPGAALNHDIELDADGLPWDFRIHSGSKSKTAKGVWKKKRGVDKELVTKVEAELRQALAAPAAPANLDAMGVFGSEQQDAQAAAIFGGNPVVVQQPMQQPAVEQQPMQQPMQQPAITFVDFLHKSTKRQTGELGPQYIEIMQKVLENHGLQSINGLMTRHDLVPSVDQHIDAAWLAAGNS